MPRICAVTGSKTRSGNNVSHAKNRTKRTFKTNLHTYKYTCPETGEKKRVKLSVRGLRTLLKGTSKKLSIQSLQKEYLA